MPIDQGLEGHTAFKIEPSRKDELRALAHARQMTLSELMRSAVEDYLLAPDRCLCLRLSTEDYTLLEALAEANGQTPIELVREAVDIVLDEAAPAENPFIAKARRAA
jgi:predicted DNA-binding protein